MWHFNCFNIRCRPWVTLWHLHRHFLQVRFQLLRESETRTSPVIIFVNGIRYGNLVCRSNFCWNRPQCPHLNFNNLHRVSYLIYIQRNPIRPCSKYVVHVLISVKRNEVSLHFTEHTKTTVMFVLIAATNVLVIQSCYLFFI